LGLPAGQGEDDLGLVKDHHLLVGPLIEHIVEHIKCVLRIRWGGGLTGL
jgi:hypothetical protein